MTTSRETIGRLCAGGVLAILMCFFTGCDASKSSAAPPVKLLVFASASTTTAVQEISALYTDKTGVEVVVSFASSSALAKQIESGAPADLFISANPEWMDYLEAANRVVASTRVDLLRNRLVLIAPADSPVDQVVIENGFGLSGLLGADGRLAMGDPAYVPAGIYGKQSLETLGVWASLKSRVAPMQDVRAALAMVERGETPLGVVYATDAALSERVKVVGVFPEETHLPIVYPAAVVSELKKKDALALLEFLNTPAVQAIFEKYGFALAN